jgi:hypothetical protein
VRVGATLLAVALVGAGCQGGGPGVPPPSSGRGPHRNPPPSASARLGSSPRRAARLPGLVLTANLGDRPESWRLVAHIPFGRSPSRLGLFHDRRRTSTPLYPPSFAIGGDRSIWILDLVKHRIAHYSPRGRYLGQVSGVPFARATPVPRDLAFAGDGLYLLAQRAPVAGVIRSVSEAGILPPATVLTQGHHPAVVTFLYPSAGPLLAQVEGRSSRNGEVLGTGGSGVSRVLGRGEDVRFLPGYPLVDGSFLYLSAAPGSDQDLELHYASGRMRAVRTIHVRLVSGNGGRVIPAITQLELDTGVPHAILAVVGVGPARTADQRYGDGLWLLGAFDDGSPLIWERVAEPGLAQEFLHRSLTATQDGYIYRMIPEPDGVFIYRRPKAAAS